jgi:hypothetical protein
MYLGPFTRLVVFIGNRTVGANPYKCTGKQTHPVAEVYHDPHC